MSIEAAKLFVLEVNMNKDFANKVMKIESSKELVEFAINAGFDFEAEELKEVNQKLQRKVNGELSDQELSMVIGGIAVLFPPCTEGSTQIYCK